MTNNPIIKVWMLSQMYSCPIHPCDGGTAPRWQVPVCNAYGREHLFHLQSPTTQWCLVQIVTTPPQLAAAKLDPRVVVCGRHYSKPPQQLLDAYASMLDPTVTYQFVGQVLEKLAESEPLFLQE